MSELREYYRQILWSEEEDNALVTYYQRHGLDWEGWPEVLPKRTHRMIAIRAAKLGLRKPREPRRGERKRRQGKAQQDEAYVRLATNQGKTPSEIDKEKGWWPGTAKMILTEIWRQDNDE